MARKVIKYACDFKCKRQAIASRPRMEEHEARCYRNPERQTCFTCAHDFHELDEEAVDIQDGELVYGNRLYQHCEVDARSHDKKIVYDCPQWEPKGEPEWEV